MSPLSKSIKEHLDLCGLLEERNLELLKNLQGFEDDRQKALNRLAEVLSGDGSSDLLDSKQLRGAVSGDSGRQFDEATLCAHMRDPHYGITIQDRRYHLVKYHACFIASELVDWMIATGWASTREEATSIGKQLAAKGIISHVKRPTWFRDGFYFYRMKEAAPVRSQTIWHFTRLKFFSIALNANAHLARRIENCETDSDRLRDLKMLRHNVLYLGLSNSNKGWVLKSDRHRVRTYVMKKAIKSVEKNTYTSRIVKTIGQVPVPPSQFVSEVLDFRTRRRWDSLFAKGRVVSRLGPATRIVHRTSTSPLPSIAPRDVCVFQDHFMEPVSPVEAGLTKDPSSDDADQDDALWSVVYEISVNHEQVPESPGYTRAEILLVAHILRLLPGNPMASELTIISQVDFNGEAPEWFIDKWVGQQNENNFLGVNQPRISSHVPPGCKRNYESEAPKKLLHLPGFDGASFAASRSAFTPATPQSYKSAGTRPVSLSNSGLSEGVTDGTDFVYVENFVGTKDFEVVAVLGKGAFSKILLVRLIRTQELFAMKILVKKDVIRRKIVDHVMTEKSILMRLDHPYVIKLYFTFQSSTQLYLVMSWAAGGDLFTSLRRRGLSEPLACFYTAELVCALRYLHENGIAHRDVKPENILLDKSGHVLLADFGLSKENMSQNARTFSLSGTTEYVSPEVLLNNGHSFAVDWWQLGIIIHEMLSGKHPFYSPNQYFMHQNIIYKQPQLSRRLSKEAESLVRGLLRKDPSIRLGCDVDGLDIENHAFFRKHGIDWEKIRRKEFEPMSKPYMSHHEDLGNFESMYTQQTPPHRLSPDNTSKLNSEFRYFSDQFFI